MERPKTKAFNVVSLRVSTGRARRFIVPTTLSIEPVKGDFPDVGWKPAAKSALAIQRNSKRKAG